MALEFYRPGTSLLHRFDPRAKLIMLAAFTVSFFLPLPMAVTGAYLAAIVLGVGFFLGAGELKSSLLTIAPLLLSIAVLTPVFRREGAVLWAPWGIPYITDAGIREAARLLIRFSGIALAFFAVFRSIDPNELILALRWFGLPFTAGLIMVISLRFIPSLADTYRNVRGAHSLRGSGARGGFRRLIPVLTSVIISAVRGIPTLAATLECRGLGRSNARTEYAVLPDGKRRAVHLTAAVLLSFCLFLPLFFRQ